MVAMKQFSTNKMMTRDGQRAVLPRRARTMVPSASMGPGRNQPLSKGGAHHHRLHQQQGARPRPEVSNEAHAPQASSVNVVDRHVALDTPPQQHGHSNGHTNGHASNGNGNGHATNGHTNGYTNGHANGVTNGHTNGHGSGVAVLERPKLTVDEPELTPEQKAVREYMAQKVEKLRATRVDPIPAEASKVRVTSPQVLAFVLGGGQGAELYPITKNRAEPAVPIFGSYRLIDVPLSNCLNSTVPVNKVYVLTQYNSTPLNRHLANAYSHVNSLQFSNDMSFIEPLNATLTNMKEKDKDWFKGTADAVRHYAWTLDDPRLEQVEDVIILSGDQIYRMDYTKLIQYHRYTKADITIACHPCSQYDAEQFGVCTVSKDMRVVGFNEKPKGNLLKALAMDTTILGLTSEEAAQKPYAANMGVYVFKKRVLLDLLKEQPDSLDFSRDIITNSVESMDDFDEPTGALLNIMAYPFRGYWRDVGSLKSYYEANLDMTIAQGASFPLRMRDKPLYTEARVLPPTKMQNCDMLDSVVGHGSVLRGCSVTRSVLGDCTTIREGSMVEDSIIMGASYYDRDNLISNNSAPMVGIGQNCRLRRVIVDRDACIGNNCTIVNEAGVMEATHEDLGYCIRDGIVVIMRGATIPAGTTI